jgi:hypothetical protein
MHLSLSNLETGALQLYEYRISRGESDTVIRKKMIGRLRENGLAKGWKELPGESHLCFYLLLNELPVVPSEMIGIGREAIDW